MNIPMLSNIDLPLETFEELITTKNVFSHKWDKVTDADYVALIIESDNSLDKAKVLLDRLLLSTFNIKRSRNIRASIKHLYATKKKSEFKEIERVHDALQKKNIASSEFFRNATYQDRKILKIDNFTVADIIILRPLFMMAKELIDPFDISDKKQKVKEIKESLNHENQIIDLYEMMNTLKMSINGIVKIPKHDDNGNVMLNEFGDIEYHITNVEPNVREIETFKQLQNDLKDLIALGDSRSKISKSDYLENEKKLLEEIEAQKTKMMKRSKEYKDKENQ
jgi:hypothetical protein